MQKYRIIVRWVFMCFTEVTPSNGLLCLWTSCCTSRWSSCRNLCFSEAAVSSVSDDSYTKSVSAGRVAKFVIFFVCRAITWAKLVTPSWTAVFTPWSFVHRFCLTVAISFQEAIVFVSICASLDSYSYCVFASPSTFSGSFASSGDLIITAATS